MFYVLFSNSSYPSDNPRTLSTNNDLLSFDNGLPIRQRFDLPQGNNNIQNNGIRNSTTVPSLNNCNFPNLNMHNSKQQRGNFGIQHSTAFQAGKSYGKNLTCYLYYFVIIIILLFKVNTMKKFSEKSTFTISNKDFPELPHLSNNSVETTNVNNHKGIPKSSDGMSTMLTTKNAKQFIGQNDESNTNLGSANVTDQESGANNQRSYVTFLKADTPQAESYNSSDNQKPNIETNTFLPDGLLFKNISVKTF